MKLISIVLVLFATSYIRAMEEKEHATVFTSTENRTRQQALDQRLYSLFMDENWVDHVTFVMEEGVGLIQTGANIWGPVAIEFYLGPRATTLLDVAVNVLINSNNVLPLMLLLEQGADSNRPNPLGQTPILAITTSDASKAIIDYQEQAKNELRNVLQWPRGPFRTLDEKWHEYPTEYKPFIIKPWLLAWLIEQDAHINLKDNEGRSLLTLVAQQMMNFPLTQAFQERMYWQVIFAHLIRGGASIDPQVGEIRNAIDSFYAHNDVMKILLLRTESEALKALSSYIEFGDIAQELLSDIFITAAARGNHSIVSYLLEHAQDFLTSEDITSAFVYAAQAGNSAIFHVLWSSLFSRSQRVKLALNEALIGAAARGHQEIISKLVSQDKRHVEIEEIPEHEAEEPLQPITSAEVTEEYAPSEEPPSKKRKLLHDPARVRFVTYDPATYIDRSSLYYALTRSAVRGHADVVKTLLHYTFRILDMAKEHDKAWLITTLTKAPELALMQGHYETISALLEYDDRFGHVIDLDTIVKRLKNILADPTLPSKPRQFYSGLLQLLITRSYLAIQLHSEERLLAPQQTFLRLPHELIALLSSFLYVPPYTTK